MAIYLKTWIGSPHHLLLPRSLRSHPAVLGLTTTEEGAEKDREKGEGNEGEARKVREGLPTTSSRLLRPTNAMQSKT